MTNIVLDGLQGLGDNIHQRAIIKQYIASGFNIWLKTPWPCVYYDLPVHFVDPESKLRASFKNAKREQGRFARSVIPMMRASPRRIYYTPSMVQRFGSVLAAMASSHDVIHQPLDFRMAVPTKWKLKAGEQIAGHRSVKPIMVVRPLLDRTEWGGCKNRNPDPDAYQAIFAQLRDRFFVVSIADLEPYREWVVGEPLDCDVAFHRGELDAEALFGLFSMASLVYCSPGFAVPMAQSVSTPVICVFGGYENSSSFSATHFSPYLGIDTVTQCNCFSHTHDCVKVINVANALYKVSEFINAEPTNRPTVAA